MKYLKLFEDNEEENKFIDIDEEIDDRYTDYFSESDKQLDFDDLFDKFKKENVIEDHLDSIYRAVEEKLSESMVNHMNKHPYVSPSSDFTQAVSDWVVEAGVYSATESKFDDEISNNRDWIEENLRKFIKDSKTVFV